MVPAILAGRKTQTRRVIKDPAWIPADWREWSAVAQGAAMRGRCPYGQPGDRLWVRESFQQFFTDEMPEDRIRGPRGTMGIPAQPHRESYIYYRADGEAAHPEHGEGRWTPSIHMPRWASRITLEVTRVRVERLHDIRQADADAEGCEYPGCALWIERVGRKFSGWVLGFAMLWESIKGPGSWDANPLVWVIEFQRIESNASHQTAGAVDPAEQDQH
jgi:hypothetical protein